MALTLDDLLAGVWESRRHLLRHLNGVTDEQWTWKPYPECKSMSDTVVHLIAVDRSALESVKTGGAVDFVGTIAAVTEETAGMDRDALLTMLKDTHSRLVNHFTANFADTPLDAEIRLWGAPRKLGPQVAYLTSEDYYHAGQIAYIRMATDATWDYYGSIYGAE
jgi:uncharacterized damage-inducible protein DinB